jgi:Zn-dependent membrane protease YugP
VLLDPLYLLFILPGVGLALWAQSRISRAYAEGSRVRAASGFTGAQAAQEVLRHAGVHGVQIERVGGQLTDHYDPTHKVLRLSQEVFGGTSLAALGIAAHEAGHAIQDARHYHGLVVRNLIVPLAGIGSSVFWLFILAGLLLGVFQFIALGIALFSLNVVFQLVNLPIEFDASRRARAALLSVDLVDQREDATVGHVLDAAAWTYVAATLTSVLSLLYYLVRFGVIGGGRSRE